VVRDLTALLWRHELRRRAGGYIAIVMVVALSGAVAMTALAGARRTASAFERYLEASDASDLSINIARYDEANQAALEDLPGVEQVRTYAAILAGPFDPVTEQPRFSTTRAETLVSVDGRFFDQDRPRMASGRLPDPTRPDEIFINQTLADQSDIEVGERVSIIILHPITFEVLRMTEATVTGVGSTANEVAVADVDDLQRIIFTPAFLDENPDAISGGDEDFTYYWSGLQLAPGTHVADVERAWEEQAPDRFPGRNPFRYLRTNTLHASVQQANRPQVVGLAGFGVMAALLGTALTVQVTRRVVRAARPDLAAVQGLGATWATSAAGVLLAAGLAVLLGAGMAVGLAWLLSTSAPVGLVREIEPDPGRTFDALILGIGGVGLALLGAAAAVLTARRVSRGEEGPPADAGFASRLPLVSGFGVRMAIGRRSTAARSAVVGAVVSTVAVVATLVVGSDIQHLITTPRLYGSDFDAVYELGSGYSQFAPDALDQFLTERDDPDLEGWSSVTYTNATIGDVEVPVLGVDPGRGAIGPTIVEGRAPAGPGEIALGEDTLDAVGADVGDEIDVEGQPFAVVGTAVLPALGQATSDHSGLGVGGWLAAEDLAVLFPDEDFVGLASAFLVDLRDGADADATVDALKADLLEDLVAWGVLEADAEEAGADILTIYRPARPAELVGTASSLAAPALLASMLGLGALVALGFALIASVRGRRRELAVVKSLGFLRRQVQGVVLTQTLVTVVIGLVVGIPVGIALGGVLWRLFAAQLGVVGEQDLPTLAILAYAGAGALLAILLTAIPARIASRTPAALVLTQE
jgi:FtsX-like permease family